MLLTGLVALASCKTSDLSEGGQLVAPTRDPLPPQCVNVGLVTGTGGGTFGGSFVSNEQLVDYAMNDLRNKTAELGGTHVRHDPPTFGQGDGTTTTVTITGTAYRCPGSPAAAQAPTATQDE